MSTLVVLAIKRFDLIIISVRNPFATMPTIDTAMALALNSASSDNDGSDRCVEDVVADNAEVAKLDDADVRLSVMTVKTVRSVIVSLKLKIRSTVFNVVTVVYSPQTHRSIIEL